jgi:hypothetical protein
LTLAGVDAFTRAGRGRIALRILIALAGWVRVEDTKCTPLIVDHRDGVRSGRELRGGRSRFPVEPDAVIPGAPHTG